MHHKNKFGSLLEKKHFANNIRLENQTWKICSNDKFNIISSTSRGLAEFKQKCLSIYSILCHTPRQTQTLD